MTAEIEVRGARPEDLPELGRLGAELARLHHAFDPERFMLPDDLEAGYAWWLGKELANRRAVVLAAVRRGRGGRVVGYAYGRIEPRDWNALRERCGVAVDLIVDPGARGAGVGARLTEELVRRLGELGAPRVVLFAASRNGEARRLFERLGFRPTMVEMTREVVPAPPAARRSPRR